MIPDLPDGLGVDLQAAYDARPARAAMAAATTYPALADAWNRTIGLAYGIRLNIPTVAGVHGHDYEPLPVSRLRQVIAYARGMASALSMWPPTMVLRSDWVYLRLVVNPLYGGWAMRDGVYQTVNFDAAEDFWEYTGWRIFHHEATHEWTYSFDDFWLPGAQMVRSDWISLNPPGFQYSREAYKAADLLPPPWPAFADAYGMLSYFEDIAMVVELLFAAPARQLIPTAELLANDPQLHAKVQIVIGWMRSHAMRTFDHLLPRPPAADPTPIGVGLATISTELGQVTDYTATITDNCGSGTVAVLDRLEAFTWTRKLDDTSTAQVTASIAAQNDPDCRVLGDVRAWAHELHLFRNGEPVWSGPIVRPRFTRSTVTFEARDNFAWLDRQAVEVEHNRKKTDLAIVAEDLVRAAVDLNVQAGCLRLDVTMTGQVEDRLIAKHSGYVGDAIRELARAGLSFTVLGRQLYLFGSQPLSLIGPLSDADFVGELEVAEDGLDGCSRAVVVGQGVTGVWEVPSAVGRITRLHRDDTITSRPDADLLARRLVEGSYPWPVQVEAPGTGAQLAATAPVAISELVPGVTIRTHAGSTCREFVTDMQLTAVEVQGGPNRESVQVTLAPPAPIVETAL